MTDLVPSEAIERIVGMARCQHIHYARAVSADDTVYILHSQTCLDSGIDLRDCRFSIALDKGINPEAWAGYEDIPVAIGMWDGRLIPLRHTKMKKPDGG